ncbi:ead/Ea22-like family protein [Klebsiella michiganensis]
MTDITELAQSLKSAAENATLGLWYVDPDFDVCDEDRDFIAELHGGNLENNARFIALANPANIRALVEALEKAQQQIQTHERAELTWMNALELPDDATRNDILPAIHAEKYTLRAANKRIAVLEEAEQKLCAANVTLDARAELAERRLAEMDSRTVTVKLPVSLDFDCEMENGDYDIDEEPYLRGKVDGFNYALTKVRRLNGTAGIKWEAE